jgi:D-tyrosyl-tRNA(Tyr) deacylase
MKLVIQRVKAASVEVDGITVGSIGKGLFVLVGVGREDNIKDADFLAEKLVKLRIMSDEQGKMNLSISDMKGEVLVVSQFTLYADTSQGNRPSFIKAAPPLAASEIYTHFVSKLKSFGVKVATGRFGMYMKINTELDGPVTILIDSKS